MSESAQASPSHDLRRPHPSAFAALIIPFGAMSGFVSVSMAFLCTRNGLSVEDGALLVAAGMFPHMWKYLWAPIADTTLTRKRWYLISVVLSAIGITAMSAIAMSKGNMHLLEVVIFVANLASTFLGMSVEGLMAHITPPEQRGRVGGWFQAGNLGGSGLGGGAGLWLATHLPSAWMSGAILGVAFLVGSLALLCMPDVAAEARAGSLPRAMLGVLVDLWQMIKTRAGLLCGTLCLLPINTGAATSVLAQAEVAGKWGATEDTVALVSGTLNGVISGIGCLFAGEVCARINSRKVYAGVALLMAAISAGMAMSPFTKTNYVVYSLVYAFVVGMSYTAFTGFVLDAIGKGAAATKYNVFASLSNTPITYMGLVLAWAQTKGGEKAMLFTDAGAGVVGLIVLGLVAAVLTPRSTPSPPAAA
ncbi:MAG: MFS transporter [Phycisphaerales bacterium]